MLPHTPNGQELAERGAAAGKEIILHAPMSNLASKPLGPGGLTAEMQEAEVRSSLARAIASTPHVRGVSNHMGSQLTRMREPMEWVMREVAQHQLYFVDSRTTSNSLAGPVAREHGIPTLSRHVFLDHHISREAIANHFELLLIRARQQGMAVAIGHPHPETLDHLARELPRLAGRGYELVLVSEALGHATSGNLQPHLDTVAGHVGLGLGHGVLAEVKDAGGPAPASAPPSSTPSTRWSRLPTPPEAITGIDTASQMARVTPSSKPSLVPSRSMLVSRISPAPSSIILTAQATASIPVGLRPPWVKIS